MGERMQVRLQPIKVGNHYEQILVSIHTKETQEWYPVCVVHIDTFWQGKNFRKPNIYSLLNSGNVIVVDVYLSLHTATNADTSG